MTCTLYDIKINITLEAPYLVHGNDPGRFGLDATLLKDHNGKPILPGSLVAGRIAETWKSFGKEAEAHKWFGKPTADSVSHRARLLVSDLVLRGKFQDFAPEITRIKIDEDMGSVVQGAMLVIEQIAKPGEHLEFDASWLVWAEEHEITPLCQHLRAAIAMQTQWGAYRNIGFGRMKDFSIESTIALHQNEITEVKTHELKLRLALTFDVPICVNSKSRRGNVFVSDSVISGSTVLGALAQTMLHKYKVNHLSEITNNKLAENFDNLRCTHALPSKPNGDRPMPLPKSLVYISGQINDIYKHKEPPTDLKEAPAFQTDWKDSVFTKAALNQGIADTRHFLRVRTAIKDGKADVGNLFAYECIFSDAEWQCDLDLNNIKKEHYTDVIEELKSIFVHGLAPIGKTDARAKVNIIQEHKDVWRSNYENLKKDDKVQLVLRTDALLFPICCIADNKKTDLMEIYKIAFNTNGTLELSHFFATQKLTGGNYLYKRYFKNNNTSYQPMVLTEAGSVFVFTVIDPEEATKQLKEWQKNGIPLSNAVKMKHGSLWTDHPYHPQNGYGEVVINPEHINPEHSFKIY